MINHHIVSFHSSWLHYDAGRLSMPAQQLVSSAIRSILHPAGETQTARHIRHPRPVCDNLSLIIPKSETPRPSPWGLAPTTGCRAVLPPVVGPKRPPGHLYHLPVRSETNQPFEHKEVHRFTGPHNTGMQLVQFKWQENMANNERSLIDTGGATNTSLFPYHIITPLAIPFQSIQTHSPPGLNYHHLIMFMFVPFTRLSFV